MTAPDSETLTNALEQWRASRAPEIADAIDLLQAQALTQFEKPRARTKETFHQAWLEVSGSLDPVVPGWLAETLVEKAAIVSESYGILRADYARTKYAVFLERLRILRRRLPDPRACRPLVSLLSSAPFSAWEAAAVSMVYRPLLDAVLEAGDRRAIEPLEALLAHPRAANASVRAYLAEHLPATIEHLRTIRVRLSDEQRKRWTALTGSAPRPVVARTNADPAALLAQIHEDPDDDALRQVYSDLLTEQGDPRGEFIALQYRIASGAASKKEVTRANALLRENDHWLGELGLVLRSRVFERGFLERAELAQNAAAAPGVWERAPQDEQLATVRELRQGRGNAAHYERFVTSPQLRGLRLVEIPKAAVLETLLAGPPRPSVRRLEFKQPAKKGLVLRLATSPALPNVDSLAIPCRPGQFSSLLDELESSGMLARLEELQVGTTDFQRPVATEVLPLWGRMPATLQRLVPAHYHFPCHEVRRSERACTVTTFGPGIRDLPDLFAMAPPNLEEWRVADPHPWREHFEAAAKDAGIVLKWLFPAEWVHSPSTDSPGPPRRAAGARHLSAGPRLHELALRVL